MRLVGSKGIMPQESLCITCFCFTKELQPRRIYRISGTEDLIGNGNWNPYVEFGNNGTSGDIAGFGSEQVILVRDDYTKNEICKYVGKQALVLTIRECKGLEFQDVLLYNFFGSSPLEDQWSVIYGYMKEHDWLDAKIPHSFPSFKESKHNVLCSELKQLYVAITRTRQRLWICENKEELSKPMCNYWKRRGLVQVRKLNDSVVQDMQCASSPQEWLERGKKLFYEKIFVMATMCFEKAGDTMWEKMAKAEKMRETNPETASCHLREAAEIFESIGKFEAAASCYCDLGEFETAGKFYLEKCGEIDAAAECFSLTGCYTDAAEAYATGNQFSNCLSLCIKGELFEKGLQYIEDWKKHGLIPNDEIEQHEQKFLQDFLESSRGYLDFVIPLDWRRSIRKNLISLRDTDLSLHLVEEVILQNPNIELDFTHRTIGRLMMICLSSKKSVSVYEKITGGLQWNPLWSSFFEKFWRDGFNDVYVALALQNALEDTYQADRWLPGYMSPHSFVYLLDRLLFMTSFSYGFFFTTKSSFVEWYTSTLDTTLSASEQMFSKDIVDFLVGIVQDILYKKEETISWIEGSNIVASYYHPLIALKLVMIVALVSLQLSDCSQVLIDLLLGPNNVAYLLPQKFVADLVRRRNGSNLHLSPDVVAEAFASIEDPLLIVSSKDETPKAHAPCAIFVDLRTPTKEILGVLFPSTLGIVLIDGQPCVRKDTTLEEANNSCDDLTTLHKTKNSWDDLTTPHEDNDSWDDMKHPSFAFDVSRPEVELSVSTSSKMEETDDEHSNGHHSPSSLVLEKESNNENTRDVEIKKGRQRRRGKGSKKGTGSLNTFATVLVVGGQHSAGEDTTLQQEINTACNDLQQPSSASDKSRPGVDFGGRGGDHVEETGDELIKGDHSVVKLEVEKQNSINDTDQDLGIKTGMGSSRRKRSKSNTQNTLATVLLDRQSCAKEDTTLHEASNSWDDMKLPSFASDMSHHEEEKCDDEHINGGQSLLEKQTTINSTHEAEIKKRKGENMGRWINKNEGSKIPSTFTGDGHRNGDQSSAKLVLEKQTNNDKMKIKNIKVKNMEKCINEKQTNNQKMKIKIDKGKNMEKYINEKQANNEKMKIKKEKGMNMGTCINEKQTNNEKMKIKKEKGKNMEKCITEKKKSSSILDTSTRGELINDLSSVELVLEKQNSNKNSKDVEITKGKGKNMEKWIKTNKESNCINAFTSEEHRDDDHSLVQSVAVKQSINTNTGDKFKNKKGIKSSATASISDLVDVQHYAGEDATPQEEKCACNDMKQHSLASDISLERSNITKEVLLEENHVKETNDEHKIGDHLPLELLLEKQNNNNITQNEENEKGKGKFVAGEDTTMCEANNACNDLNSPSSSFDMGTKATEGIKYGSILDAAVTFLGIRSWRKL